MLVKWNRWQISIFFMVNFCKMHFFFFFLQRASFITQWCLWGLYKKHCTVTSCLCMLMLVYSHVWGCKNVVLNTRRCPVRCRNLFLNKFKKRSQHIVTVLLWLGLGLPRESFWCFRMRGSVAAALKNRTEKTNPEMAERMQTSLCERAEINC